MACYSTDATYTTPRCYEYSTSSAWTSVPVPVADVYYHYAEFHPAWGMVAQELANWKKFHVVGMLLWKLESLHLAS